MSHLQQEVRRAVSLRWKSSQTIVAINTLIFDRCDVFIRLIAIMRTELLSLIMCEGASQDPSYYFMTPKVPDVSKLLVISS